MKIRHALGIDIGGTGIKGAVVDLKKGQLATDRLRIPTPVPSTVENVADIVAEIAHHFLPELGDGPVGVTFPAIVRHGVTRSAANVDQSWVDAPAEQIFRRALGRDIILVNDADAAGVAEVRYGAAKGHDGVVLLTTLGTGIGTALVHRGVLIPNVEVGHIEINGVDAETQAAASVIEREGLTMAEYIQRLQRYYERVEFLFSPDLIVVGGGLSKISDQFLPHLRLECPIVPAKLRNLAGIVGAAWLAADAARHPDPLRAA